VRLRHEEQVSKTYFIKKQLAKDRTVDLSADPRGSLGMPYTALYRKEDFRFATSCTRDF
jgi:hypothetical protein